MLINKEQRNRERVKPMRETPIRIATGAVDTNDLTLTFDQAVTLKGVPQYAIDVASADPVSAVMTDPMTVVITYSVSIALGTEITIPFKDPAIRNSVGGYVADSTFTFA